MDNGSFFSQQTDNFFRLERRVAELETILELVLNNYRETAIMNLGAIEDAKHMKRSIPNREERNRQYQLRNKAAGAL